MAERTCIVDGCNKPHLARGLCGMHYLRWKRHGDPLAGGPPRVRGRNCSIDGCERPHCGRGLCEMHYQRWKKHGDPLIEKVIPQTCSVEGCEKPHLALGLCSMHRFRLKAHGDTMYVNPNRLAYGASEGVLRALVAIQTDECVIWPYSMSKGYGQATVNGVEVRAHQWACIWAHGPKPLGHGAAHSCDVPACVNPRHLRWATHAENMADKKRHAVS